MNSTINYYKYKKQNNLQDDDRSQGVYLDNNFDEFSLPQQNYYYHQQNQQLQAEYNLQHNHNITQQKKMDNSYTSGKNMSDQSLMYQTPQKPKMHNNSNIDTNIENALPNIYQNNKVTQRQQQLLQLQLTQKKQSLSQQRSNYQKTRKKGDNLIHQNYGNNLFKNSTNSAALNTSLRQQNTSFQQTIKKSSNKTNVIPDQSIVNPFLSDNEADDEVNRTFPYPQQQKIDIDDSLYPQNFTDLLLQPQKLNKIGSNTNTSTNGNLEIIKTRASVSLNEPTKDIQSFTDSEANDQTSSNRYNRKKNSVKRRSREINQMLLEHGQSNSNYQEIHDKLENININEDLKQQQIITFRNNWSKIQNDLISENEDPQYLTQQSNITGKNKMTGQNFKDEQKHTHSYNNPYLRFSQESVDSIGNSITNTIHKPQIQTNTKLIDCLITKQQLENKPVTEDTDNYDDQTDQSNNISINQQRSVPNSNHQNQFRKKRKNTFNVYNQQTKNYQEYEEQDLSPVPPKPRYEIRINDVENRNDSQFKILDDTNSDSYQRINEQHKRKQRSHSNRLQHLDQKESELINMIKRDSEFGVKGLLKNQNGGFPNQMNQLQVNQNMIQNKRLNDLKKHIQVKDIQNANINIDLNDKNSRYETTNKKSKTKYDLNVKNNLNQYNTQNQQKNYSNSQYPRTNKKATNSLENGIYLYNNNEFDTQDEENNTQSNFQQQNFESLQKNTLNKQNQKMTENNNDIGDHKFPDKYQKAHNNNSSEISTNISSSNQSTLNERQNGQSSKEPYSRQKGNEKSQSQMHQQTTENYLSNDPNNDRSERKIQSNSISPDSISKNESVLKYKLAKACIRFTVLGGGETIEAEDYSLKGIDDNGQAINKFRINIKNVLEIEDYMEQIYEHLSNSSYDYIYSAEKLIFLINEDPQYNINQVHRFFSDEKLCRVGKVLTVLELISIYLIFKIGKTKKLQIRSYFVKMKNLFAYTHQSFLLFWDYIYLLFTQNIQDKDCLERLRVRIEEKRQVKLGNKKSSYLQLKQNYDIICNQIKPIIKDIKEINADIAKLFKVFEDQSIVTIFNSIKSIFGWDKQVEDENRLKEFEIESNKLNTSLERQINPVVKRVRNVKPYLPAQDSNSHPYTLVLDLDETLIHFFETRNGGQYQKRPFCDKFLREMNKLYELVIFTAGTEDYANWVLNTLDKNKYITYRLFRQHTNFTNCVYVKDLSKIGRDLSKTIIVDNVPENFRLQRDNGIGIKSWYNDRTDSALNDLIPVLTELVQSNPEDVRIVLKKLRQKYPPNKFKGYFDLPY